MTEPSSHTKEQCEQLDITLHTRGKRRQQHSPDFVVHCTHNDKPPNKLGADFYLAH